MKLIFIHKFIKRENWSALKKQIPFLFATEMFGRDNDNEKEIYYKNAKLRKSWRDPRQPSTFQPKQNLLCC